MNHINIHITPKRQSITNLDMLPIIDRSFIDYEKYSRFIGQSMVKDCLSLQGTRGCPYKCAFCHKIWPKAHYVRSAENLFNEINLYYNMGVRRFVFIDDIFNLNRNNTVHFYESIIKNGLKVQLFYPNGLRCDLLTKDYIDLMVEAGVIDISFALDTASPRLQKLIGKNLDLERFRENIEYVCNVHPQVILEFQVIHGFPTETEAEALMSLDFVRSIKWLDFPYIHILKIFPGTDMERLAMANGVSREAIIQSQELTFDELPYGKTGIHLPFNRDFTYRYQAEFLHGYVLLKERLLQVLPNQMRLFSENEMVQKYNSYLPFEIKTLEDLLHHVGITREELGIDHCLDEDTYFVPDLNQRIAAHFPGNDHEENALRVLLLDLTLFFNEGREILYNVVEIPLGLLYLMSYLKQQQGRKINGKIAKSRIDFNSYEELILLAEEFKPDIIGLRSLTLFKKFFHETVARLREWRKDIPLIAGGPYATSNYQEILQDANVDLAVLGEGEITFNQLIGKFIENNGKIPDETALKEIDGIAFMIEKNSTDPGTASPRLSKVKENEILQQLTQSMEDEF